MPTVAPPVMAALKERHGIKNDSIIPPAICVRIANECSDALVQIVGAESDLGLPLIIEFKGKSYNLRTATSDAMHLFNDAARKGGYKFTRVR